MPLQDNVQKNMSEDETEISSVTRSKVEARASYNMMSKWYDMLAGFTENECRNAGLQKLSAKEGEIVLDIGFGTGHSILALAQSVGNSGKVYGIDISEGMCNITQSRVREAELSGRVKLRCGDAAQPHFKANFFDAVFMSFTLELFDTPEIPIVLHECQRVLRNGGRICVVAMSKKGKANVMTRLYEWIHGKLPKYVDCRPIFVQESLEDVGFQIVDITKMSMARLPIEIVVAKHVLPE